MDQNLLMYREGLLRHIKKKIYKIYEQEIVTTKICFL